MRTPAYEKKIAAATDQWMRHLATLDTDYGQKLRRQAAHIDELFVSRNRLRWACFALAVAVLVLGWKVVAR